MALVTRNGRYSLSNFKVIKRLDGFTYVEVYPKTGRTHQIWVHLDTYDLYGKGPLPGLPLLHAHRISFTHPVSGEGSGGEAPVPDTWRLL